MRYQGGKFRLASDIAPIINLHTQGRVYIEPFVGACYVMERIHAAERFGYDLHCDLIEMWKAVQGGWLPPKKISYRDYQLAMNGGYDNDIPLKTFILFGCSYGGKYRGGYAREGGRGDRNFAKQGRDSLFRKYWGVRSVAFKCQDVFSLTPPDGSIVYCDPPYKQGVGYRGLPSFDHDKFYETVRTWAKTAELIFISENTAPDDFVSIWNKTRNSELNNGSKSDHVVTTEHLFVHESQRDRVLYLKQRSLW